MLIGLDHFFMRRVTNSRLFLNSGILEQFVYFTYLGLEYDRQLLRGSKQHLIAPEAYIENDKWEWVDYFVVGLDSTQAVLCACLWAAAAIRAPLNAALMIPLF